VKAAKLRLQASCKLQTKRNRTVATSH
jgi:hypothetical protein